MQLDKLTKNSILKATQMLKSLSNFKYVKVKSNGTVVFKNHWYSIGLRVSMYQILFKELPKKLSLDNNKDIRLYLYPTLNILSDQIYDYNDLVDYYYQHYIKTYYPDITSLKEKKLHIQGNYFQERYYFMNHKRFLNKSNVTLSLLESIMLINVLKKHNII